MPRRRWLVWSAVTALLAVVGLYLGLPRSPRFTDEQFDRIQVGMTRAEVEAVLGCPPGCYAQEPVLAWIESPPDALEWAADSPGPLAENGDQPALRVAVCFDDRGKVEAKFRTRITYTPPTLLERLRRWAGW